MKNSLIFSTFMFLLYQNTSGQQFVQSESIQLAQPRLMVSGMVIDQAETISIYQNQPEVQIFYTIDGTEPTRSSLLYRQPLRVENPGVYQFKAFHEDFRASEVAVVVMHKKGLTVDSVTWISEIGENYPGVGPLTLVNHKKANSNYRDPEWMGFDQSMEIVIKFDSLHFVESMQMGFLSDPGSWIFPPEELIIWISENGQEYVQSDQLVFEQPDFMTPASAKTEELVLNKSIKALRIEIRNLHAIPEWHEGKGKKAWMFLDELIFYE